MNKRILILNEAEIYTNKFFHEQDLIVRRTSNNEIFNVIKNRYGASGLYTLGQLTKLCAENGIWSEKLEGLHPVGVMKSFVIEDISTEFATEFVKDAFSLLQIRSLRYLGRKGRESWYVPFIKMSYVRRRKIVSKVLDKIR